MTWGQYIALTVLVLKNKYKGHQVGVWHFPQCPEPNGPSEIPILIIGQGACSDEWHREMQPHASQNIVTEGSQETGISIGQLMVMPNKFYTEKSWDFKGRGNQTSIYWGSFSRRLEVEGVFHPHKGRWMRLGEAIYFHYTAGQELKLRHHFSIFSVDMGCVGRP